MYTENVELTDVVQDGARAIHFVLQVVTVAVNKFANC